MIGFVTWPPFIIVYRYEKPIILVKICYKIVSYYFDKVTSWPQLISNLLAVFSVASDWPHTFLQTKKK